MSSRLTTNAGASFTSTADFFSARPTANAVASVASSVVLAAHDLEQRQHRDRVEEVEADHPLGMVEVAGHLGDRERRRVRGEHRLRPHDALRGRRRPAASPSAPRRPPRARSRRPRRRPGRWSPRPGLAAGCLRLRVIRPLARPACRSQPWTDAKPASTRSWSRSVITTGTSSRRTKSRASWVAISPAPTMPTLLTGRASALVRCPRRAARPLLHQVERVEAGPQLGTHDQVGERLVLGREPGVPVGVCGRGDEVEGSVRRRGGAVQARVDASIDLGRQPRPTPLHDPTSARRTSTVTGEHLGRPLQRLLEEVRAAEHGVGDARGRKPARPFSIVFWLSGVLDDDLDRARCARPGSAAGKRRPSRAPCQGTPREARWRRPTSSTVR